MNVARLHIALITLSLLVALSACSNASGETSASTADEAPSAPDITQAVASEPPFVPELNEARFYDALLFARHENESDSWELAGVKALVAPHYSPMLFMLASALKGAASETPTVLIIGPDHTGKGGGITLSGRGWHTPEGDLQGDGALFTALMQNRSIGSSENDELLQADHAAATLVPYVAKYLPDARVVTVLIGKYTSHSRLKALAEAVYGAQQQSDVLLICSVDFSHYLPPEQVDKRDRESIAAINASDITGILNMDSENMDSPECMAVFLELAALWDALPELRAHETDFYLDTGEWRAGSYMAWALYK